MSLGRFARALPALTAVALVAALPADAKDRVTATLKTKVPLHAPAGHRLRIVWTLSYRGDDGRRHPFGAGGVFVRLVSASHARSRTATAREDRRSTGRYTATVSVPHGGIRDIQIGLRSWTSGPDGTRQGEQLFPITNDPLP